MDAAAIGHRIGFYSMVVTHCAVADGHGAIVQDACTNVAICRITADYGVVDRQSATVGDASMLSVSNSQVLQGQHAGRVHTNPAAAHSDSLFSVDGEAPGTVNA